MDMKSPVYHALMRRRSEIAGQINNLNSQLQGYKTEIIHLDATLGIMGYDVPNLKFRAKTTGTAGLFHRGELGRLILQFMRTKPDGIQMYEVADLIAEMKGWDRADKRFMVALNDKVSKHANKMKKRYGMICDRVDEQWVWRVDI